MRRIITFFFLLFYFNNKSLAQIDKAPKFELAFKDRVFVCYFIKKKIAHAKNDYIGLVQLFSYNKSLIKKESLSKLVNIIENLEKKFIEKYKKQILKQRPWRLSLDKVNSTLIHIEGSFYKPYEIENNISKKGGVLSVVLDLKTQDIISIGHGK